MGSVTLCDLSVFLTFRQLHTVAFILKNLRLSTHIKFRLCVTSYIITRVVRATPCSVGEIQRLTRHLYIMRIYNTFSYCKIPFEYQLLER